MQVEVHGDEAASYAEYLKVPDAWTQGYKRLRSANDTTAMVAVLGIVLTLLAAVVVLFREGRRNNVRWRVVLLFTSVAFGLFFLLSLNDLPIAAYRSTRRGRTGRSWRGRCSRGSPPPAHSR